MMLADEVLDQLAQAFAAPLEAGARRRVVIWSDPEGEFSDDFALLAAEGLPGAESLPRPVRLIAPRDGAMFAAKRLLYREDQESDFLVYRQRPAGSVEGDWLADIELYAQHFQADSLSMLVGQLDAADTAEVRAALERLRPFFRAKDRMARFRALMPRPTTRDDVLLGVLAALLHAPAAGLSAVIGAYSRTMADAIRAGERPAVLDALERYGADGPFARLLAYATGYEGDPADGHGYLRHLLLSATAATLPDGPFAGLERYISPHCGDMCLSVVHEWAVDEGQRKGSSLHEACLMVEGEGGVAGKVARLPLASLVGADVLPCVNEAILEDLLSSMAKGADRCAEARTVSDARRGLMWRDAFAGYFDALEAAARMQRFYQEHATGFHASEAAAVWEAYVADWWRMDVAYRCFCDAHQRALRDASRLDDAMHDLARWADALYANWFLPAVNECWVRAAEPQWRSVGWVQGIPRQADFYRDAVLPLRKPGRCVVVGISDAMRYGVGRDLADRLNRELRGNAEVKAMQAVFPSETKFGMAALLPHHSLAYDEASDAVLADGMPTRTTEDRQRVLQAVCPASKAIQLVDLLSMRRDQRRAYVEGLEVLYVYQNSIDKAGHGDGAGQEVSAACDRAIDDMRALVDVAVKDLGARDVLVTADHGFLFSHQALREIDLVGRKEVEGAVRKVERRFVRAENGASSETLIPMAGGAIDGGAGVWLAARDCVRIKAAGSAQYVHGGVSLEELCVPVVSFRSLRSSAKDFVRVEPATVQLLSSSRRITSSTFVLDLFQANPVGGKVLPAEYDLVFVDADGREVSDVRRAFADKVDESESDRVMRVRFALKPEAECDPHASYWLVARDSASGVVAWREEFRIELPSASAAAFNW